MEAKKVAILERGASIISATDINSPDKAMEINPDMQWAHLVGKRAMAIQDEEVKEQTKMQIDQLLFQVKFGRSTPQRHPLSNIQPSAAPFLQQLTGSASAYQQPCVSDSLTYLESLFP